MKVSFLSKIKESLLHPILSFIQVYLSKFKSNFLFPKEFQFERASQQKLLATHHITFLKILEGYRAKSFQKTFF